MTGGRRGRASAAERANQRNALLAGFLGWTLDAFDFFILVMVLDAVATEFGRTRPDIALTLTASLAMRPVGALLFGVMADRYGRRLPLMLDLVFYSVIEVLSGLAPDYRTFLILRLLFGIGMGGEWGVGASLAMESVPAKWRGVLSGLLQEGYAFGYLLAALAYFVVFPRWGWRTMFFIGGLPALLSLFVRARVQEPAAWHEHRLADRRSYVRAIVMHWRRFVYLAVLMAMMNLMSHGTQDMYPTFLQHQRQLSPQQTALVTMVAMVGAVLGGVLFGLLSDRFGRRRAMVTAVLGGLLVVPLWVFAPSTLLIVAGAFMMQFMVQGAWGVIPAHLIELSPGALRGFFPGFAYQLGVLAASGITYIEAVLGEHFTYAQSMGLLAAAVLASGAAVIALGPEARGVSFRK
ncbi:MAG TPA: MFS transporter, partial [Candidatus Margulisiibacteriota bacterium]|nr:MFS transporter [Candidatus Margulisiibacteriota bacterium]